MLILLALLLWPGSGGNRAPIDFGVHVEPVIEFRIHVSPAGAKSMDNYLAIGSDNVIRATKMRNEITGLPITDATVTGTLYDKDGAQVTGGVDVPMPLVGTEYQGTLPATITLLEQPYRQRVRAVSPAGTRIRDKWIPARST